VAEQLGLDDLFRNRRAIDRHEGPGVAALAARAHAMQRACRELLAGARFAVDQHRRGRRRDALDAGADLANDRGIADHAFDAVVALVQFAAQDEVFAAQRGALEAALHRVQHLRHREGLEQEVGGTRTQRIDRGFQIGIGGHQHHVAGEALIAQLVQPFDARTAGQGDVEHDQVEVAAAQQVRLACSTLPAVATQPQRGVSERCRKLTMPGSSSTTSTDWWRQGESSPAATAGRDVNGFSSLLFLCAGIIVNSIRLGKSGGIGRDKLSHLGQIGSGHFVH
jgi:hypothetical protein